MSNLLSHCGLVDAKIRASNKDLPLIALFLDGFVQFENCCLKYDYSQQKHEHASKHIHCTHFALHN